MAIFIIAVYSLILLLAVSISGYLSYEGLLRTAHEITIPLVVFLMAIIFIMDCAISYFRKNEKSYVLPLFIWCVAAFFSIASNFNFLYSNFMRDDVTESTVTEQISVFRDDLISTRSALVDLDAVTFARGKETDLEIELGKLREQINDPLRPGCGEECRGHMETVERILGQKVTNLAVPQLGSDLGVVNEWFDRYKSGAQAVLSASLGTTDTPAINRLVARIDQDLLEYGSAEQVLIEGGGLGALAGMSEESRDIEREANSFLPEGEKVDHEGIDPTLGRLGEIVYAFQNGFGEMPNPMATFVSLILASVVDVLPLLLSFALFGRGKLERTVSTGTQRGAGKRRIVGSR